MFEKYPKIGQCVKFSNPHPHDLVHCGKPIGICLSKNTVMALPSEIGFIFKEPTKKFEIYFITCLVGDQIFDVHCAWISEIIE